MRRIGRSSHSTCLIDVPAERFDVRAVTLATYTPTNDEDDKTVRLGLRLIELIGECLR
jgi:hypothetical protein